MHPLLFKIGPVPIHTYGAMIALGFLMGIALIYRLAKDNKVDVNITLDLVFWLFIAGFIGCRLYFIATQWDSYSRDPISMLKVWEGGLVFYGGPMLSVPLGIWLVRRHKLPVWKMADTLMPGLAVGHMFGRFGCLAAGCCYGKPTGNDFGVKLYSDQVEQSLRGINLHPTQLYEASGLLVLILGLLWVHKHKRFDGQVALTYFMVYPIIRSVVEVYRGDLIRGFLIEDWVSWGQATSFAAFLVAAGFLVYRLKQLHPARKA